MKTMVKIIDTNYNEILSVEDGGTINIKYPDGHMEQRTVKYNDSCHFSINGFCYHYYQFAEILKSNGKEVVNA